MSGDEILEGLELPPLVIEHMIALLGALLGPQRSLLTTRFDETPLLPMTEDERARLLRAAAHHVSGAPSLGLALTPQTSTFYRRTSAARSFYAVAPPCIGGMRAFYAVRVGR